MFDHKDPLFRFGLVASVAWLVAAGVVMTKFSAWNEALSPNAWGDLFAGVAAPMAFLWLVLGFLQQGKELRLSTRALLLQVEELKNTVAHQAALVDVSREQVAAQLRQEEMGRQQHKAAVQPRLVLTQSGSTSGPGGVSYNMALQNAGAAATNVQITFDIAHTGSDPVFPTVGSGERKSLIVHYKRKLETSLKAHIRYRDLEGLPGETIYIGRPQGGNIVFELQIPGGTSQVPS